MKLSTNPVSLKLICGSQPRAFLNSCLSTCHIVRFNCVTISTKLGLVCTPSQCLDQIFPCTPLPYEDLESVISILPLSQFSNDSRYASHVAYAAHISILSLAGCGTIYIPEDQLRSIISLLTTFVIGSFFNFIERDTKIFERLGSSHFGVSDRYH